VCHAQQRGAREGEGLSFSLCVDEASGEVDFDLMANSLRGIPADQLPIFLRPAERTQTGASQDDEGEQEDGGGLSISFDKADASAFFAKIALALATAPSS
jgi:hypothetical protein